MKTLSIFCLCLALAACTGVKLPPQCEGSVRPLNNIKLSALDESHACLNNHAKA